MEPFEHIRYILFIDTNSMFIYMYMNRKVHFLKQRPTQNHVVCDSSGEWEDIMDADSVKQTGASFKGKQKWKDFGKLSEIFRFIVSFLSNGSTAEVESL